MTIAHHVAVHRGPYASVGPMSAVVELVEERPTRDRPDGAFPPPHNRPLPFLSRGREFLRIANPDETDTLAPVPRGDPLLLFGKKPL